MDKVAILVPSMNRSNFLRRLISYYESHSDLVTLYIGDSSEGTELQLTRSFLSCSQRRLTVHHRSYPNTGIAQIYGKLMPLVTEKYVSICCDDDLLLPSSIVRCVNFLSKSPSYASAQGASVIFQMELSFARLRRAYLIFQGSNFSAEEESSFDRLSNFANNYWVPHFSVVRRNVFERAISVNQEVLDQKLGELYLSFNIIAQGKSKYIPGVHVLREDHASRNLVKVNLGDWRASIEHSGLWKLVICDLMKLLSKNSNMFVSEQDASRPYEIYLEQADADLKKKHGIRKRIKTLIFYLLTRSIGRTGAYGHLAQKLSIGRVAKKANLDALHVMELKDSVSFLEQFVSIAIED